MAADQSARRSNLLTSSTANQNRRLNRHCEKDAVEAVALFEDFLPIQSREIAIIVKKSINHSVQYALIFLMS